MGYWGPQPFENDRALDWIGGFNGKFSSRRVRKAFKDYLSYSPAEDGVLTPSDVENIISQLKASFIRNPPRAYKESGKSFDDWLRGWEADKRDYYESGRYLAEDYGPAEEAIAAVALLAATCSKSVNVPDSLRPLLETATIPSEQLRLEAMAVLDKVLGDVNYAKMRSFYLSAFPCVTQGDDSLAAVIELRNMLAQ